MSDPEGSCSLPKDPAAAERILSATLAQVLDAHQADRARLARFLHDEIAQFLSGIGLQLDILRMDFEATSPEISARTIEIQGVLEQLVQRVRDFTNGLSPDIVERVGLGPGLDRLVGQYRRLFDGSIRLLEARTITLPAEQARVVYRIADLAMDNAVRHARASKIEIILRLSRKRPELEVRDDGCGFDVENALNTRPGLGLMLMRQAADRARAELKIHSSGTGTSVVVRCPPSSPAV